MNFKEYYKERLNSLLVSEAASDYFNPKSDKSQPMSPRDAYAQDKKRAQTRRAQAAAASRAINAGRTGKTPGSRPVYPQDDGNTIY